MKTSKYSLRALSLLLSYPDHALRALLPDLIDAIDDEGALPHARRAELRVFADALGRLDPFLTEERYVETFDRGRATSLHLFEHVHGDSRERGPALIDLIETYRQAGLEMAEGELPDHLCVVLEFASTQPPKVARAFLAELAHILKTIFGALQKRGSPYAAVLAAVLELAGERAVAVDMRQEQARGQAQEQAQDQAQDQALIELLDDSWEEPAAFDGCSTRGQARPGAEQTIQIVRKKPNPAQGVAA